MKKKPSSTFHKFSSKKSNAAIKEQFKNEKRAWKKEREEFFDKKRGKAPTWSSEFGPDSYRDGDDAFE